MSKRITVASLALVTLLALPAGLSAQRAGFMVGLAPGARPPMVSPVQAGHVIQPFVTPQAFGFVVPPAQLTAQGQIVRRGGQTARRGGRIMVGRGNQRGRPGGRQARRGNQIARQGQVFFVGPPIAGVFRGPLPQHPIITPVITVIAPRGRNPITGLLNLEGRRLPRGVPAPNFGTPTRVRQTGNRALVGFTRADVIRQFGRPNVTIINSSGETLIFGGTTVIIQNGQVAIMQ